jgi:glutamate:Na+ symporter, ESS family
MFNLETAMFAFVLLAALLLVGRYLKRRTLLFQRLYLPESVLAGVVGLLLGPQVLGALAAAISGESSVLAGGVFPEAIRTVWGQCPKVLINIVFACLLLGESIPPIKVIWRKAAPQVVFGMAIGFGQYVVGALATLLILIPVFGSPPIAASLIEVSFAGGHGTAGGMIALFEELQFPDGGDLALALATVSLISSIVIGTALTSWGRSKGYVASEPTAAEQPKQIPDLHLSEETPAQQQRRERLFQQFQMDMLTLNVGWVGLAIAVGWVIQTILVWIESITWGRSGLALLSYVPLFPLALIGGMIVQLLLERTQRTALLSRELVQNIAGIALDFVVASAIATMSLQAVGNNLGVFLTLAIVGIGWVLFMFLFYAPRIFPTFWFEKGIGDFGQSMGVTSTGILLMRIVDGDNHTGAFESFAYKQIFFEPILGGGLATALSPLIIAKLGLVPFFALSSGILLFWFGLGYVLIRKERRLSRG